LFLIGVVRFTERVSLSIVTFPALDDVNSIPQIVLGGDFGVKSETIE